MVKIVMDGCGSCKHSQCGVILFSALLKEQSKKEKITSKNFESVVNQIFEEMLNICDDDSFIINNYSFTILACIEENDCYTTFVCGDGYIITEDTGCGLHFTKIDNGDYPKYYIYNYIKEKASMIFYRDGVSFDKYIFPKKDYNNIGVATDGLRFRASLFNNELEDFNNFIFNKDDLMIYKFLNIYEYIFLDDIAIVL